MRFRAAKRSSMRRTLLIALWCLSLVAGAPVVRAEGPVGTDLGPIRGIAVDRTTGAVYVSGTFVYKIVAAGAIETLTYAASNGSQAPLSSAGIAFANGKLYLTGGNQVWRWDESSKVRTVIAGTGEGGFAGDGGAATAAKLWYTVDVSVDGMGNVFVADWNNNRIRQIDPSGIISTAVGWNGFVPNDGYREIPPYGPLQVLDHAGGIGVDARNILYVADSAHRRAIRVLPGGIVTRITGTGRIGRGGENGPAYLADTGYLLDIAADATGNVWIAERGESYIEPLEPYLIKVSADGFITRNVGFGEIGSIAVGQNGNELYVGSNMGPGRDCVWLRTATGGRVPFAGRC